MSDSKKSLEIPLTVSTVFLVVEATQVLWYKVAWLYTGAQTWIPSTATETSSSLSAAAATASLTHATSGATGNPPSDILGGGAAPVQQVVLIYP